MATKSKPDNISKLTYDEALQEAEDILRRLENEKLPIDQVITQSRRVASLIKHCKVKIAEAGKEVDDILDDLQDEDMPRS